MWTPKILEAFCEKTGKDMGVCDPRGMMPKQEMIQDCPREGTSSSGFQGGCGYS